MVVGALVAALSISCKSNEEPPVDNTHSNHPPSGTYTNGNIKANVSTSGGTCNISGNAYVGGSTSGEAKPYDITITKWFGGSSSSSGYVILENGQIYGGYGEASINKPEGTTDFRVEYYNAISLRFDLGGTTYRVDGLKREE